MVGLVAIHVIKEGLPISQKNHWSTSPKPSKISAKNVPQTWFSTDVLLVMTELVVLIFWLEQLFIALEQMSVMVTILEVAFVILATSSVFHWSIYSTNQRALL